MSNKKHFCPDLSVISFYFLNSQLDSFILTNSPLLYKCLSSVGHDIGVAESGLKQCCIYE